MTFIQRVLKSKKPVLYVGLKSATLKEIKEYKDELRNNGISYMHLTKNLPYNGILKIIRG